MIKEGDIAEIVKITKADEYYSDRESLIGSQGVVIDPHHEGGGWFHCSFMFLPDQTNVLTFYLVKLRKGERR